MFASAGMAIAVNFKDLKVGVERASVYASWFEAKLPEAEVVFYDTSEALYINLQNGRTDIIMTNPMKAHLRFISQENGEGGGPAEHAILLKGEVRF